jgi:hypothetical protein
MTENRTVLVLGGGGVAFYVTQVTPTYRTLTPVNDPAWLFRHVEPRKPER